MNSITVFWFRRDLRLFDNHGLYKALESGRKVLPIFIFDKNILSDIEDKKDARISFIHQSLEDIHKELEKKYSGVNTFYGKPIEVFARILNEYNVESVYANGDYEPYALDRDKKVEILCSQKGTKFKTFKDHVVFEKDQIVKDNGTPYLVYTPYSKRWLHHFSQNLVEAYPSSETYDNWVEFPKRSIISLQDMGFERSEIPIPEPRLSEQLIINYKEDRDILGIEGTSKVGIHLRFGTMSIRELIRKTAQNSLIYFKELIWREFFITILYHYPKVVSQNFNSKYDGVKWRNNMDDFEKWCTGQTGYPIVDAGMRELNSTGFMHNRVRMVTASFLTKHLLIDWRWGEAYFAKKLLDFELASNNGNWQWAAGTGVDASPYFRVFNPSSQQKKFDPKSKYVNKWIEDLNELTYPMPIVEHKMARERAISTYKEALNNIN